MNRASLSDVTGATLVRFETADGLTYNFDDAEAARTIGHGGMNLRALPGSVTGDAVEPYLYALLRLDPHRFIFDLPSSMRGTGATQTGAGATSGAGHREGFVHLREKGKNSPPVGKVIFLTYDRRFAERDPHDRDDFERMR